MTALTSNASLDALNERLQKLLPAGTLGEVTRIREGDEHLLVPEEQVRRERAVTKVRQASGAPNWPPGVKGSMAHAATLAEQEAVRAGRGTAKQLFCIKEAVFKAVHRHDGVFLEFHQVEVDFPSHTAVTSYGRKVSWQILDREQVPALAWW